MYPAMTNTRNISTSISNPLVEVVTFTLKIRVGNNLKHYIAQIEPLPDRAEGNFIIHDIHF